jgi:hypothetical protein
LVLVACALGGTSVGVALARESCQPIHVTHAAHAIASTIA